MSKLRLFLVLAVALGVVTVAAVHQRLTEPTAPSESAQSDDGPAIRPGYAAGQEEAEPAAEDPLLDHLLEPWQGDFDAMAERGFVRLLTVQNPIFFTYDGVHRRGMVVEWARALEKHLTKTAGRKAGTLNVVTIPVARDDLLPYLMAGKGDLVAANLTVTRARQARVDFSDPVYPGVDELVVTGPAAELGPEGLTSLDDLTGIELHVRRSSSYFEHLAVLNRGRSLAGKAPIPVIAADERLEDYDLLELVNAGLIPAVIVDSHKAALWAQVFDNIAVHEDLAIHRGGTIAWALRQDSPQLRDAVNGFLKTARKGTLFGNVLIERYLGRPAWIDNVRSGKARERYEAVVGLIRKYAAKYDFDWIMITAQGYQESKLDQSKVSPAGAVGVMQVLPTTAADPKIAISGIDRAEANVHAGVKYLRFLLDRYFSDPEMDPLDRQLFTFAAYNAGPRAIARARKRAAKMGLDPDRWFGHVEVAAARTISREPVIYVRNIFKYYVAYSRIAQLNEDKAEAAVEVE